MFKRFANPPRTQAGSGKTATTDNTDTQTDLPCTRRTTDTQLETTDMQKITNEELGRPTPEEFAAQKKLPLTVVLDNVRSANNVGAFFRTGDAFGIERLVLCGITGTPPSREIHKSALGAEMTVAWEYERESTAAVQRLRESGYTLLAVEQVHGAIQLDRLDLTTFAPDTKFALVFGNEVEGVSQQVVDLCHGAIEIPQVGTKHSLNVSVSGGVVLWEFFRQMH